MSCPDPASGIIAACDFPQFFAHQVPQFDEMILEDVTLMDGWLLNVGTGTLPPGTPVEITQDRLRGVWPNTTRKWRRVVNVGNGCQDNPCDPQENLIGWGADRRSWFAEEQTWATPLLCYDQDMHITHAEHHINQLISDILKPATLAISSAFLRKRALDVSSKKIIANRTMAPFTFQWEENGDGDEVWFDCSVDPDNVFMLVPQMLQNRFNPLMRKGYGEKNPYKETLPYIELVTGMDTAWFLDKQAGQVGAGGVFTSHAQNNWRFTQWDAANNYWRYGFSGQVGNYLVRVDELNLRFNFLVDLGAGAHGGNGNRYRYQIVLPYYNEATTGAGGAAGLGRVENDDFDKAQFTISNIWHKLSLELLSPESRIPNAETPYKPREWGGRWQWQNNDLVTADGSPVNNAWGNKGRFGAWFKYWARPLHTEFAEAFFHKREQFAVPEVSPETPDPGYPIQSYNSANAACPLPE